jgi:hypothetical protein
MSLPNQHGGLTFTLKFPARNNQIESLAVEVGWPLYRSYWQIVPNRASALDLGLPTALTSTSTVRQLAQPCSIPTPHAVISGLFYLFVLFSI